MTFKIRERHFLKSKLIKQLQDKVQKNFLLDPYTIIPKNSQIEYIRGEELAIYAINKRVMFIEFKDTLLPSLQAMIEDLITLPKVTVDKGAIPYVTKGAQIMVPGITKVDPEIKKGDYVVIIDEIYNKPIAIGKSLMDSEEIESLNKGKAVKNLHYVGDKIWNFIKQLE
ncbi:MAG: DUF1947 domain-containing protein [Promethearchaeota archaeon]